MPPPFAPLQGYDLPTTVQRILEEVDGRPPAPAFFAVDGIAAGTLTLQPDNRGPAAVVVGLTLANIDTSPARFAWSVDLQVKGVTLVEGEMAFEVLEPDVAVPAVLQAPIRLDSKTPLKIQIGPATGESPLDNDVRAEMQVLYGSPGAVDEVMRRLGQARWWAFWGPRGGDVETGTLTVEIGGRPTYVQNARQTGTPEVVITLDGLSMTPQAVESTIPGTVFLPHDTKQAQVYAYSLATGGAGTGRAFWAWHGPSDDY